MKNMRRILLLAVALGVLLGAGIAFWRVRRPAPSAQDDVSVQCPTSAVQKVVEDAGQRTTDRPAATNAVPPAVATNVAANVQPPKLSKPPIPPKPPAPPVSYLPTVPKSRQVLLANRRIVVEEGRSFPKEFCAAQTPTARGTAPYVVISEAPVSREVRIQAVADGAKVVGFLPNNALLVEADASALKNLEEDATFLAAVEYEPTDKIQRRVLEAEGETVEATVVLLNPADRETVSKFVTDNGGVPLRGTPAGKSVSATIPISLIKKLAGKAEVKWIERYVRLKPMNNVVVRPGLANVVPVREAPLGLTGAGQIISTSDSGIDTGNLKSMHEDLKNAVCGMEVMAGCRQTDVTGHGTHTAGSLVGSGKKSSGQYRGVAFGAKIWAWFCLGYDGYINVPDYDDLFRPYGTDAHIHSGSWGGSPYGCYSDFCWENDAYVWKHPDFLPVFAAGNFGAQAIIQPATSKNCLAVGATESYRPGLKNETRHYYAEDPKRLASFSSTGPCDDGRIKPDIVAPGTYVLSCLSSCASRDSDWNKGAERYDYYQYMGGASMSTPITAGSAALVREWLAKYRNVTTPSASLVKAILTGGANGGIVPDNDFGWGRVDLEASIFPTNGLAVYLKDWLPFKRGEEFVFHVMTTNAAPLSAQLAWIDYPAEEGAAVAIQNDLDLSVQSLVTGTLYGNGKSEPDRVNTVESVRIAEAPAATYVVTVSCPTIKVAYDDDDMDLGRGGAAAIYIRGAFDSKKVVEGDIPVVFYLAGGRK